MTHGVIKRTVDPLLLDFLHSRLVAVGDLFPGHVLPHTSGGLVKLPLAELRNHISDLADDITRILLTLPSSPNFLVNCDCFGADLPGLNELATPQNRAELKGANAGSASSFSPGTPEKPKAGMPKALAAAAPNLCLIFSVVAMLGDAALATEVVCGPRAGAALRSSFPAANGVPELSCCRLTPMREAWHVGVLLGDFHLGLGRSG